MLVYKIPSQSWDLEVPMKLFFPAYLGAIAALGFFVSTPLPAAAQEVALTSACRSGPTMFRYTLPRDDQGNIAITNSLDPNLLTEPVRAGSPICLAAGQETVHVLDIGYGAGIAMPTYADMLAVALTLEREANEAIIRAYDQTDS